MEVFENALDAKDYSVEGFMANSLIQECAISINTDSKSVENYLDSLPEVRFEGSPSYQNYQFSQVQEVRILGVKGRQAVVHAIKTAAGDTVYDIVKGLHPGLNRTQIEHEVNQIQKYNRDFGNKIPRGGSFCRDQLVYLTSMKDHDSLGRIKKVVRPDGTLVEVKYGKTGILSSYRITDQKGLILESARSDPKGSWIQNKSGFLQVFDQARVDDNGNIIVEELSGNLVVHLTNGVTLLVEQENNQPRKIDGYLNGARIQLIEYQSVSTGIKIETTYFDMNGFSRVVNRFVPRHKSPPESFDYDSSQGKRAIVLAGKEIASSMRTTGRCAEGVQLALARAGYSQFVGSGHAWEMLTVLSGSGLFESVNFQNVEPGDIMVRKSATGYYGHIAIIVDRNNSGVLKEASDHLSVVDMHNNRYSETVFLRLKGQSI